MPGTTAFEPGARFRAARERLGLTVTAAAARAGTSQAALSHFETGRRRVSIETLLRWCAAVGIDPYQVDGRLPKPAPKKSPKNS